MSNRDAEIIAAESSGVSGNKIDMQYDGESYPTREMRYNSVLQQRPGASKARWYWIALITNYLPKLESWHVSVKQEIRKLAAKFAADLKLRIDERVREMEGDDKSHFLIYQVLGVSDEEGHLIDVYQNKGRFLYKYAGSFLENAAKACFKYKFPDSGSLRVPNTRGQRPKTFEIDCLVDPDAIEIKWRDATTDGDHITKEHTRIQAVSDAGYKPIRVMFYYPNRSQAMKIQEALETLYNGVGGEYHFGDAAWKYVKKRTGVDLHGILKKLAKENAAGA